MVPVTNNVGNDPEFFLSGYVTFPWMKGKMVNSVFCCYSIRIYRFVLNLIKAHCYCTSVYKCKLLGVCLGGEIQCCYKGV